VNIPQAPERYDRSHQNRVKSTLEQEDHKNRKKDADIELVNEKLIIRSPNGSRFYITVSNAGALTATAL
jgi:hypothetical protein